MISTLSRVGWVLVCAAALAGCGSSGGGGGGGGGSSGDGGGSGSGSGACGDHGFGCMYGSFCHDTPAGKQDVCEQQSGTWLGGSCPKENVVGCCITPVPGTSGTLIDYYYSTAHTTGDVKSICGTNEFHGP